MKKEKTINKIKKHITCFYSENKMLSYLSFCAVGFIIFYYFSYNMPELWKNASILVDILFQLSLAIVANLIFFIFQVYIPNFNKNIRIRPIVLSKIKYLSNVMNDPFLEITKKYLECEKNLNELSDNDIEKIAEKYCPNDETTVQVMWECRNMTFYQYFEFSFEKVDNTIQELLFAYDPYLNSEERDILLIIKENSFRQLFSNSFMYITSLFNTTGIHGDAVEYTFKKYIKIYNDVLSLVKN